MEPDSSSKLRQPRRTWIPYFVLVVTLLLTGIATYYVEATAKTQTQLRFESAVQLTWQVVAREPRHFILTQDNIQNRLDNYISLLRSGSGLFAASQQVTRDDFRAYIERLELRSRYPGIQGIGFTVKLSPVETTALVADLRNQGVQNFAIRPPDPRREYHTIIYLEPLNRRNQAAIGFDMFTELVRRAAMERARDTGNAAASGKVTLVQEIDTDKQAGFLIYFPIYRNNANLNTVAQRRAALYGFAYSPFRADDLLQDLSNDYYAVDFEVYDGSSISFENLLHRSHRQINHGVGGLTTTRTLDIAGRTWSIVFSSRPDASYSEESLVPYIVLGGALISLVLFGLTRSQSRAKTAAEKAVAQMHKSQVALQASESRLRRLVESNIIGIITADLNGQIFEANQAFLQMVGYSQAELRAGTICWDKLTPPEYAYLDAQASQDISTSGACTAYEKEYLRKDGSRIPVLLGGAILEGKPHLYIAFVLDLTERERLEVALRQQTTELAEANRLKDDFLAIVSHELRTPLNAILGWVQLLRSRRLNEEKTTKALEVIERNAKAQAQLIEDLLDVSRLIRGDIRLQMRQVDFVAVIETAMHTVQPAADAKKIQMINAIASQQKALVWGDPDRLQQIVWNLLSNAVKFTPDGGKVTVTLDRTGKSIEMQVRDTGIGISPEFLPYVFDRFRQAESATTRASSGLGLGLAIVRQLVELHGGTVFAASPGSGQGATFTVKLPLWDSGEGSQASCLRVVKE